MKLTIQEDVKIIQEDKEIILEKGDQIEVLKESSSFRVNNLPREWIGKTPLTPGEPVIGNDGKVIKDSVALGTYVWATIVRGFMDLYVIDPIDMEYCLVSLDRLETDILKGFL